MIIQCAYWVQQSWIVFLSGTENTKQHSCARQKVFSLRIKPKRKSIFHSFWRMQQKFHKKLLRITVRRKFEILWKLVVKLWLWWATEKLRIVLLNSKSSFSMQLCVFTRYYIHPAISINTWVQVNLCQKLLFLHQLTHNMTTDCSLNYKFNTWKFQAQTWGEHVVYRNCFWHS